MSSVLTRLEASCSEDAPRCPASESISSKKIVDGLRNRAISKSNRTIFSDSPRHLLLRVAADTLKKVVWHSCATALASIVLPVPGGPNIKTPFQGLRKPWKTSGIHKGSTTASWRSCFASLKSAISSQVVETPVSTTSRSTPSMSSMSGRPRLLACSPYVSSSFGVVGGFRLCRGTAGFFTDLRCVDWAQAGASRGRRGGACGNGLQTSLVGDGTFAPPQRLGNADKVER
mmetsp:Transcript_21697/g.56613  ORF Transcript_21697/g.56613 Transcript_21697/m.56613 type:complete len:230 (+) Transcript_21697:497-1186(+)